MWEAAAWLFCPAEPQILLLPLGARLLLLLGEAGGAPGLWATDQGLSSYKSLLISGGKKDYLG